MQMSGMLETFPPAELLQWAHNDQVTGTLAVRRSTREKRILLREGSIVGCLSNESWDFFGRFLLAGGYVEDAELVAALSACEQSDGRLMLGEALAKLGILDRGAVADCLREQTAQSIIDIFLWPRGVFFLLEDNPPRPNLQFDPIEPMPLILEGVRQIDEVNRIRARLPHDGVVLQKGRAWPGSDLGPLGKRIVDVFQRDLSLAQLHEATGGGYAPFLAEADALVSKGVLSIDRMGEPAPDTVTLSLLDIMLDRIQDERRATIGATVAMPMAVLGQMYALWLDHGDARSMSDVPGRLQHFVEQLDGTRKLGTLLSLQPEERDRELEWLWLRIGNRRLALLPFPADEAVRARFQLSDG